MDMLKLVNCGEYFADKIVMEKEGKYITLRKEGDDKREFRYDLSTRNFERIRHYKTKEDKIDTVYAGDVTSWFAHCDIITSDEKFAKMFITAAYVGNRYKSSARFIELLGHYKVREVESWLSRGIDFKCLNEALESIQNGASIKRAAYHVRIYTYYTPDEFDKQQLKYLRSLSEQNNGISTDDIRYVHYNWNPQQYHAGKKLDALLENNPRYQEAFMYTEFNYQYDKSTHNYLTHNRYGRNGRNAVLEVMCNWSLDPEAFINYLLKLKHEAVEIDDLMRNYNDYLQREYEMKNQRRVKMNKYPTTWESHYKRHYVNYQFMKSLKRALQLEGKMEAYNAFKESKKHLEYKDKRYLIRLPENIEDIANEATQLEHCLYDSYTEKILDGETVIMFMRDVRYPDDSLLTVEVKYNGIEQARGHKNADPTPAQEDWLLKWASKKGLQQVIRQNY